MKTIIAGSRSITTAIPVHTAIQLFNEEGFTITELASGGARGVDRLAEGIFRGKLPIKQFIPNWDHIGKGAGHVRNGEMADYADALVAVWDGKSNGTSNMISQALLRENIKIVLVFNVETNTYWVRKHDTTNSNSN